MKRFFAFCLVLSCLLALAACAPETPIVPPSVSVSQTDAPVFSDVEAAAATFLINAQDTVVDCSKREYSYTEMVADLQTLADLYPNQFSYRSFGKTVAGRDLYVGILGNPTAPRQVLVSAGLHGREYLTPLLVMKQLEFYLKNYKTGHYNNISYETLFNQVCFYVIPMNNPDGIMLSQKGIDSLSDPDLRATVESIYRSDLAAGLTSQADINGYLHYWKANGRGVDLNRNFDALWEQYYNYNRPSFAQYKGPKAASEPETQATAALTKSLPNPVAVLCIHSQGEVLYWNCGQKEELSQSTLQFTKAIAARNGYEVMMEKNNDASFSDWCALEQGLIAITVETGLGLCPLDLDKFAPIWEDNYDLLPLTAAYFLN